MLAAWERRLPVELDQPICRSMPAVFHKANMLRAGAQKGLQVQSQLRSYAVPALSDVSNTAASSVGWLGKLLGGSSRIDTPMTDPLPGVEVPPPSLPSKAPTTEATPLSNGVTIASEATPVRIQPSFRYASDFPSLGMIVHQLLRCPSPAFPYQP